MPDETAASAAGSGGTSRPAPRGRLARFAWSVAAFLLLLFPAARWAAAPPGTRLRAPRTPLDRTTPWSVPDWEFLAAARDLVPPGETFTVRAADRRHEMNLFMMSIGLLPRGRPEPSSYAGFPYPGDGLSATYVLDFGCSLPPANGALVARVPHGCVLRRDGADGAARP